MTLRNIIVKSNYDSREDDVYNEFFSRIFAVSSYHVRFGGVFSSETLALCASGIQEFIKNGGVMKLVLVPKFKQEDIEAIREGLDSPDRILSSRWIEELDNIQEQFQKDHVQALAWMIANQKIEIRIALVMNEYGMPLNSEQIEREGILNEQVGIFYDGDGNAISFRGMMSSFEIQRLRVFKSWIEDQREYVENDYKSFQEYWDLTSEKLLDLDKTCTGRRKISTIELPLAVKQKLLDSAPSTLEEIKLIYPPKLRPYQTEAIENWLANKRRGLFEMATGTGKTFTAIGCIKALEERDKRPFVVVVVCPYINLVAQWKSELSKWGYETIDTMDIKQKWLKRITSKILDANYGITQKPVVIVTTYDTFSSFDFKRTLNNSSNPVFVIADEVHSAGSKERSGGLIDIYQYRLGLSATPERYFDDEGTQIIKRFFGPVVFQLGLAEAIQQGFLCEYEYYPYFVALTREELATYRKLTSKIARNMAGAKIADDEKNQLLERYLFERSRLIVNAQEKIDVFKKIINEHRGYWDYSLVYCSEKQIDVIQEILDIASISNHRITADVPRKVEDRITYLEMFEQGIFDVIVAIKVLDEGLDIPAIKNAIIMASTGNPKQYVQRRGRVLRKFNGKYKDGSAKNFARIYDVFVIPDSSSFDESHRKLERSIVAKEIRRYEEMVKLSRNPEYGLEQLNMIKRKYDLA